MPKYDYEEYNKFLRTRSSKAGIYRKFWLYPFLCRKLIGKTLDIGSGLGDFVMFRRETIGVDINPTNVAFIKDRGGEAYVMEEDMLPFSDGEFDSINIDNVLEHLIEPNNLMKEMCRVVKPGGVILIGVPGRLGFKWAPDHEVYYSRDDLIQFAESFGLKLVSFSYMPFKFSWFEDRLRQYCYYALFEKPVQA